MKSYHHTIGQHNYIFKDLKDLMAKASPTRSGDYLAGLGAMNAQERVAAQMALADVPLKIFLNDLVVPYESDEITRLIIEENTRKCTENTNWCNSANWRQLSINNCKKKEFLKISDDNIIKLFNIINRKDKKGF